MKTKGLRALLTVGVICGAATGAAAQLPIDIPAADGLAARLPKPSPSLLT